MPGHGPEVGDDAAKNHVAVEQHCKLLPHSMLQLELGEFAYKRLICFSGVVHIACMTYAGMQWKTLT